ncbi:MAG: hypothetical protein ACYDBQ_03975 [Thermoplasmatota archaeon]
MATRTLAPTLWIVAMAALFAQVAAGNIVAAPAGAPKTAPAARVALTATSLGHLLANAAPSPARPGRAPPSGLPHGLARERSLPVGLPVPAPPDTPATPGSCGSQTLQCVCPQAQPDSVANGDPTDSTVYGCPIRVYDNSPPGGTPFGNPQIVVNPNDPNQVAFFSLDGTNGQSTSTPTDRSRDGSIAYTSNNQGITWNEVPPDLPGFDYWAEGASGAMDSSGNVYAEFLYSHDVGQGNVSYGGEIVLYKEGTLNDTSSFQPVYGSPFTISGRGPRNPIDQAFVVDVPPKVPAAPTANDTSDNATALSGGPAQPLNTTGERVSVVWYERSGAGDNSTLHMAGWIDAASTSTAANNTWTRLNDTQLIGPCSDASNPVAWRGRVYVACQVAPGYHQRRGAHFGDLDVWSIDPVAGKTRLEGYSTLNGGHPMLATNAKGHMVLVATRRTGDSGGSVQVAFGWYGRQWGNRGLDLGPSLHALAGGKPVRSLSVNAVAIADQSDDVLLVYKEWVRSAPPKAPDPNNPPQAGDAQPHPTDYRKVVYAFNECNPDIGALGLVLGTGVDPYNYQAYQERPAAFNDILDGLQTERDPSGRTLFTFAIDDYGAVQYGSIIDPAGAAYCPVLAPLIPAPPPVPQALASVQPAGLAVGSVVGVAAAAMVAYLLTVKRRAPLSVTAEDK